MKKLLLSLLLVSKISYSCPIPTVAESAFLDATSTSIGLMLRPNAVELNPAGFVGTAITRGFILINEDKLDSNTKATASAVWTGAGVHNILHLLGLSFAPSILIGVITGLVIKSKNDCEK